MFEKYFNLALVFFHTHRTLALCLLAVLAIYAMLKPKGALKLVALIGVLIAGLYLISLMAEGISGGTLQKQRMIDKSRAAE